MDARLTTLAGTLALLGSVTVAATPAATPDAAVADTEATEARAVRVTAEAGPATVADPDTTGAAIWAHLQEEDYRESWRLWPGTEELYEGGRPHGMLLTTYVNDIALEALNAGRATMPAGAIVVKENYTPDRELAAVTVMYKRPGYNPEHNDWFFTKHLPDGSLDTMPNGMAMEGRLPGCQSCHMARAEQDYLYTERPGGM